MPTFLDRAANGSAVLVDGDIGYKTAREGSRWYVTNPTVGTAITAPATSFNSLTPLLSFDTAAPVTTPGSVTSGTRMVPSNLLLSQTGTVAGGTIIVIFGLDRKNRYSTGGTQLTPLQTSIEVTTGTTGITAYQSPTLNAAGANVRYFAPIVIPAVLGTTTVINLGDAYLAGHTSFFGVWVYAATTAPTLFYNMEWVEERVGA